MTRDATPSGETSAARRGAGLDLRALALMRVGLAVWLLLDLLRRCGEWEWLYGPRALPSPSSALLLSAADTLDVSAATAVPVPPVGLLLGLQEGGDVTVFVAALAVSYLCIGLGFFYRGAMAVALLGACAFATRQPLMLSVLDGAVIWWMVLLWTMPLDARWALGGAGPERRGALWEQRSVVTFNALIVGSLVVQALVLFGVLGSASWHVGWELEGGDTLLRVVLGGALCLSAIAWTGWTGIQWARSVGSLLWMMVVLVCGADGGHGSWIGWMLVLALAGLDSAVFARLPSPLRGDPAPHGDASALESPSRWQVWASVAVFGSVVAGSVLGLVGYEVHGADGLFAPRMWTPMETMETDAPGRTAPRGGDSGEASAWERWSFVMWRGPWVAPAQARQTAAEALCVEAVGVSTEGAKIDLFAPTLQVREETTDAGCASDDSWSATDRLRRHPWARRALLTDLARRAWTGSEGVPDMTTVELHVFGPGDAKSVGELLYSLSRPPERAAVGDFR